MDDLKIKLRNDTNYLLIAAHGSDCPLNFVDGLFVKDVMGFGTKEEFNVAIPINN